MLASLSGQSQNSKAGFSLVEVVLAVGIMAMGVVTILGLLPHGMEMSRKTANEQAETRIVDQLVGGEFGLRFVAPLDPGAVVEQFGESLGKAVGQVPQATLSTRGAKLAFTRPSTPFCSWIMRGRRSSQAATPP